MCQPGQASGLSAELIWMYSGTIFHFIHQNRQWNLWKKSLSRKCSEKCMWQFWSKKFRPSMIDISLSCVFTHIPRSALSIASDICLPHAFTHTLAHTTPNMMYHINTDQYKYDNEEIILRIIFSLMRVNRAMDSASIIIMTSKTKKVKKKRKKKDFYTYATMILCRYESPKDMNTGGITRY